MACLWNLPRSLPSAHTGGMTEQLPSPPSGSSTAADRSRQSGVPGDAPLRAARRPGTGGKKPLRRGQGLLDQNLVGYIVLGVGVLAVLGVVALAIYTRSASDEQTLVEARAKQERDAKEAGLIDQMKESVLNAPKAAPPPQEKPRESYFNRQPDIQLAEIKGAWKANMGDYVAFLDLQDDVYQIVIVNTKTPVKRVYSRGVYTLYQDILLFIPRTNWPPPAPPAGDPSVFYEQLIQSEFPLLVAMQKGNMLWQNPPQSEKRVSAPRRSPVFMTNDIRYVVWRRM